MTKPMIPVLICLFCLSHVAKAQQLPAAFGGATVQGPTITTSRTVQTYPTQRWSQQQPVRVIQPSTQVPQAHVVQHPQHAHPQATYPQPVHPQQTYPQHTGPWHVQHQNQWVPSSHPFYVSTDQYKGINPYTGGIDTQNEQVNDTYYDRNRETSKNNGTRRWVRRAVYGANGQITGYEEGWVWRNSVTGVEHGDLKTVTENNQGGTHTQIRAQMAL